MTLCGNAGDTKYFTKIDLSLMFYCFMLDDDSMDMCTIVIPYGKYRYRCLPMGVKVSLDYAQAIIEKVLAGLHVDCYINDMGLWTNGSFDEHVAMVDKYSSVCKTMVSSATLSNAIGQ